MNTQEAVQDEPLADRRWGLLRAVRRSVRYHDRRIRYYDRMHAGGRFLTLLCGTAAFATCAKQAAEWISPAFALSVAGVSALELAFGFAAKARAHADLKRRFVALESAVQTIGLDGIDEAKLRSFVAWQVDHRGRRTACPARSRRPLPQRNVQG